MPWYEIMFAAVAVVMGLITAAAVFYLVRKVAREEPEGGPKTPPSP